MKHEKMVTALVRTDYGTRQGFVGHIVKMPYSDITHDSDLLNQIWLIDEESFRLEGES